ncbi:hypothetical protein FC15_GL000878 [Lapidilactobacillus concavus DSM 17758]|uniref:Phage protein n=1 Tax=Lapidilactobacillus concavus DSM 17758 TaxID=1423735 RepID=A0A0R1W802_9LACO|nr:hypothetical protein FC15_GL000878 [Lapidilactobacillus concavus DSM 17758]
MNKLATADKFEDVAWVLQDPIINFSQHVVDQSIEENCRFQAKAGLSPKITRRLSGRACKWCINLAGFYDYFDKPDDIYRRHENCRCTVEYYPGDGRKAQNSHTKKWREIKNNAKMELRKSLNKECSYPSIWYINF